MKEKDVKYTKAPLQYFPASIIEDISDTGKIFNDIRIYTESKGEPDLELPPKSYYNELKNFSYELGDKKSLDTHPGENNTHKGPKLLYCITMYQEEWSQILQTLAGCIRSIWELHQERK